MATLLSPAPASKPITVAPATIDPWYDREPSWVDPNTLTFGARLTLRDVSGVHRVVRTAEMGNDGHFRVRVRELAENGSMVGPVRSIRPREVAELVIDEPKAEPAPAPVQAELPAPRGPVAPVAEPAVPASSRPRHAAVRAFPALHGFALAEAAVAEGRAMWLTSKPADEPRLVDDDGTPLETPRETDARHRSEHMARVRELMVGNRFLTPCCDPNEPAPCSACVAHEGPSDLSDDGWDDSHVWAPSDFTPDPDPDPAAPTRLAFADWVAYQAAEHAKIGGERHAWLAGKIARLAEQARHLDATSPDAFEDRLQAQLDAAAARIEARHAARCG